MWWKNLKMKLMIACITFAILGTIALIVAAQVGAFDSVRIIRIISGGRL
jgi:hypothetical protein